MPATRTEPRHSLWMLAATPGIWAAHFMASYVTAAIWCARVVGSGGSLSRVRAMILVYSITALAGILVLGWRGWSHHRAGQGGEPRDSDSPSGRHRFLGFATFLLAGLGALAIVFQTLPALFMETCR